MSEILGRVDRNLLIIRRMPKTTSAQPVVNQAAIATLEGTSGGAPTRSPSQRMEALRLANAVRSERAQIKRDLKASRVRFESLLQSPPECVHTAKVVDLMLAMPRYGRVKVSKVLQQCRISPSKTVAGLSERQRLDLVDALSRR